jgi:chromosomal replication initiator protein
MVNPCHDLNWTLKRQHPPDKSRQSFPHVATGGFEHVIQDMQLHAQTTFNCQLNSNFWTVIKEKIKSRNKDNKLIETWLEPVSYVDTVGTAQLPRMVLGVPSPLHQYFVVENLLDQIYAEISAETKRDFELDLVITGIKHQNSEPQTVSEAFQKMEAPAVVKPMPAAGVTGASPRTDLLNNDYTFSTFVVGRNTEFAHAASFNVAQNPAAEGYNPLFICGPVGMGKTHLLHAVGNQIKSSYPQAKIHYVSAERFLNECVSSIRRQEMDKFRLKYREECDILLVDDVQMIGKTEAVQEEFFHTINTFIDRRKQVVIAADRMPKDILGLEDRNRSRLEWGLIADISMPDLETRVAILRYKSEKMGLRLSDDVVNHVARISKRSIRELEGNLKKVKMFSELQGLSIDIDLVKRVLATHETQSTISLEDIQKMVADHFKVRVIDLKSTTRAKQIVVPRQTAMYLIKRTLDRSLVDIGRAFGGKDHTTVMNALQRVDFLMQKDMGFRNDVEELTTRIHNITGL